MASGSTNATHSNNVIFLGYRTTMEGGAGDLPDHRLAETLHDKLHDLGCPAWWENSSRPGFGLSPACPREEGLADGLARSRAFLALKPWLEFRSISRYTW